MTEYEQRQFAAATEYLSHVRRRKSVYKRSSSYGWKHQAEHFFEAQGIHEYIGNTVFIAAAKALGFIVERIPGSPNCWLNISASESYSYGPHDNTFLNHHSGNWVTFAKSTLDGEGRRWHGQVAADSVLPVCAVHQS